MRNLEKSELMQISLEKEKISTLSESDSKFKLFFFLSLLHYCDVLLFPRKFILNQIPPVCSLASKTYRLFSLHKLCVMPVKMEKIKSPNVNI